MTEDEVFGLVKKYLAESRRELVDEFKKVFHATPDKREKQWIKSAEVKELLQISHGKLQTMRKSATIEFTKIGGTIYYNRDEIEKMFEDNRVRPGRRGQRWSGN